MQSKQKQLEDYLDEKQKAQPKIASKKDQKVAMDRIKGNKISVFHRKVRELVAETGKKIETTEPYFWSDQWKILKLQLKILAISLSDAVSGVYINDGQLLADCTIMDNLCMETRWPFSIYNNFKEKLHEIVRTARPSHMHQTTTATRVYYEIKLREADTESAKNIKKQVRESVAEDLIRQEALAQVDRKLSEKLKDMTGAEILERVIVQSQNIFFQKIDSLTESFNERLKEQAIEHQTMLAGYDNMLDKLSHLQMIGHRLELEYPAIYKEFTKNMHVKSEEEQDAEARENALKMLTRSGFLSGRTSPHSNGSGSPRDGKSPRQPIDAEGVRFRNIKV